METQTFIIIIVAITVLFGTPLGLIIVTLRQNPVKMRKAILAISVIEGLVISAFVLYVFLIAGGLQ